jgi:hypothetical protein
MGQKTLPTIWGTYMKLVTKYQISAINSCWEKCDEKWAYMLNGQYTVCYDKVYDLLLVRTLYGMTKFMICYWSVHCMLRSSLWFVTGQNTVRYVQVYDLLLVSTLPMIPPFFGKQDVGIWWVKKRFPRYGVPIWTLWPYIKFLPSIVAEKNVTKNEHICSMCIKINKVGKQEVGIWWVQKSKFMICYWSVHCMLRSSLWFVTGQNTVRYDQVYDLLLVSTLYVTTILVYACDQISNFCHQ